MAATACQTFQRAAATAVTWAGEAEEAEETQPGSTILNTAAARRIATVLLLTDLAATRGGTPLPTVRLVPDNNWDGRGAIWPVIERALAPASATGRAADWEGVTGPAEGGQTALEAGILREGAAETETHSAEVPEVLGDSTDRARVPIAAAVAPAWDPEVEEGDVAAVAGGGERWL